MSPRVSGRPGDQGNRETNWPRQIANGAPAVVRAGAGVGTPRAATNATMAASRATSSSVFPSLMRRKRRPADVSTRTFVLTVPAAMGACPRYASGASPKLFRISRTSDAVRERNCATGLSPAENARESLHAVTTKHRTGERAVVLLFGVF